MPLSAASAIPFLAAFPALFHVTRRTAVESIQRDGLLPAGSLGAMGEKPANRDTWTGVLTPSGGVAWLRWQGLKDHTLVTRLPPSIQPHEWRAFINAMVFFSPSLKRAERLMASPRDKGIDQIVLKFNTAALLSAGCDLRVCRWNNGFVDRSKPRRQRAFSDYRPVGQWRRGEGVAEIAAMHAIPASVPFKLCPPQRIRH